PIANNVVARPSLLWPPNHKLVPVNLKVSTEDNRAPASCKIISVSSNEPSAGLEKDDLAPDWQITGDLTLRLRAERSAKGRGRVYTIIVQCTDSAGHASTETVLVRVPHDFGHG